MNRKNMAERARTCWRRNPHTGRLEMHWQAVHPRQPAAISPRGAGKAVMANGDRPVPGDALARRSLP
ncbi:MAG: hypothetical protein QOK23_4377 [Gammaproteobacteria bacterium]|jgi:hypothetical protein|nr:hypothetical protein [Gammaproteobacteria bacterium]